MNFNNEIDPNSATSRLKSYFTHLRDESGFSWSRIAVTEIKQLEIRTNLYLALAAAAVGQVGLLLSLRP